MEHHRNHTRLNHGKWKKLRKKLKSRGANLANQKGGKMIEFIATVS